MNEVRKCMPVMIRRGISIQQGSRRQVIQLASLQKQVPDVLLKKNLLMERTTGHPTGNLAR